MKKFRIKAIKEMSVTLYNAKLETKYEIQELKQFLWFKPKWKPFKVLSCFYGDCYNKVVVFDTKREAQKYLKGLKEVYA